MPRHEILPATPLPPCRSLPPADAAELSALERAAAADADKAAADEMILR